jgi:hypothetical protein
MIMEQRQGGVDGGTSNMETIVRNALRTAVHDVRATPITGWRVLMCSRCTRAGESVDDVLSAALPSPLLAAFADDMDARTRDRLRTDTDFNNADTASRFPNAHRAFGEHK